jgi:hypothetical protein
MFILRPKTDINHSAWNPEADITLFSRIAIHFLRFAF